VTRQGKLVLSGVVLIWAAPALVLMAGTAATASAPSPGPAGSPARVAAPSACPGRAAVGDTIAAQEREMRCLIERARSERALPGLLADPALDEAAAHKSADILRCDEFSHEACGRDFAYWIERSGGIGSGCSGLAENIAWGTGGLGTPRAIFRAWMRSPGHRRNILGPYGPTGIGLRVGNLEGRPGAHVWTQEFAAEGC
jgi:uncharacterized protein YkwD